MQVKDSNRISGRGRASCRLFDEIDAILGTRAASQPPALLESAGTAERAATSGSIAQEVNSATAGDDPFPEVGNDDGHQGN